MVELPCVPYQLMYLHVHSPLYTNPTRKSTIYHIIQVSGEASALSVSWVLCCAIALGSPIALVGIIILAFDKEYTQIDQKIVKAISKTEPELCTQDLNSENVRFRKHLGVVPTPRAGGLLGPVQTV